MKIVIAAPLFPPDIGGPATYTYNLAKGFAQQGIDVLVVTFGAAKNLLWERTSQGFKKIEIPRQTNKIVNYFSYFSQILQNSRDVDVIYIHDIWSVGLPVFFANLFLRKKMILRLGGDSLWEKAAQKYDIKVSLEDFYKQNQSRKLFFSRFLQDMILRKTAKIIFSCEFLKDIFLKYRKAPANKSVIIENSQGIDIVDNQELIIDKPNSEKIILFAGRLAKCKNLETLLKVFCRLTEQDSSLRLRLIGQGPQLSELMSLATHLGLAGKVQFVSPQSQETIFAQIAASYLCCLVSFTEVSPNFALECLALKKPLVLTKHNGLPKNIKRELIMVNPYDEQEIFEAIANLLDKNNYQNYRQTIARLQLNRTWGNVINEHIDLFSKYV